MMTAEQAYRISEQNNEDKNIWNWLQKEIEKAISRGDRYVKVNKSLSPDILTRLRDLGYDIRHGTQFDDYSYRIWWGK